MFVQLFPRADAALRPHQVLQQAQFPRAQLEAESSSAHLSRELIEREVGDLKLRRVARKASPRQGTHPGHDFSQDERFRQIIVRPKVQPTNAVLHLSARGEQQNGRRAMRAPQFPEHLQPVAARQHDIQDYRVERLSERELEGGFTVSGDHDFGAGLREGFLQGNGDFFLVFHDEDAHRPRLRFRRVSVNLRAPESAGSNISVREARWRRPGASLASVPIDLTMIFLALKMLTGDRTKYAGLLFGVTFTSFLVTFAAAYFGGMMNRSYALVAETPGDVWVMDPAVVSVEPAIPLPDSALNRVRSVPGVRSAVPLIVSNAEARYPDGTFQSLEVIGVDDESPGWVAADAGGAQSGGAAGAGCCRDRRGRDRRENRFDAVAGAAAGARRCALNQR